MNEKRIQNLPLSEVWSSASRVLLSGMGLVEAKTKVKIRSLADEASRTAVLAAVWHLGGLALIAGLIIELGNYLGGQYGLSSLLMGSLLVLSATFIHKMTKKEWL